MATEVIKFDHNQETKDPEKMAREIDGYAPWYCTSGPLRNGRTFKKLQSVLVRDSKYLVRNYQRRIDHLTRIMAEPKDYAIYEIRVFHTGPDKRPFASDYVQFYNEFPGLIDLYRDYVTQCLKVYQRLVAYQKVWLKFYSEKFPAEIEGMTDYQVWEYSRSHNRKRQKKGAKPARVTPFVL
jgi:hypothetical protein